MLEPIGAAGAPALCPPAAAREAAAARLAPSRAWTSSTCARRGSRSASICRKLKRRRSSRRSAQGRGGPALLQALTAAYKAMERLRRERRRPALGSCARRTARTFEDFAAHLGTPAAAGTHRLAAQAPARLGAAGAGDLGARQCRGIRARGGASRCRRDDSRPADCGARARPARQAARGAPRRRPSGDAVAARHAVDRHHRHSRQAAEMTAVGDLDQHLRRRRSRATGRALAGGRAHVPRRRGVRVARGVAIGRARDRRAAAPAAARRSSRS